MTMVSIHQRNACRICGSAYLHEFLRLPDMPLTDEFVEEDSKGREFLADIGVFVCRDCWVCQTQHDADTQDYYADYQYSVGATGFASRFMSLLSEYILETFFPQESNLKVLEIGSGDGEQLLSFKNRGHSVLGFEPSKALVEIARQKGVDSVLGLFDGNSANRLPREFQMVDIVLMSYTFDHIPDPMDTLSAIGKVLNPQRGVLVIENHDVEKMLHRSEYCLFEHEHSIYLDASTAQSVLKRGEMALVTLNPLPEDVTRANSLIFIGAKQGSRYKDRELPTVRPCLAHNINVFDDCADKIQRAIGNLDAYIDKWTGVGKKVAGYGAGGRGILTLAPAKSASKLIYLADKKPKSEGIVTPRSHVPVVPIAHMKRQRADKIIVFSFGYMDEIVSDLAAYGYEPNQFISMLDVLEGKQG